MSRNPLFSPELCSQSPRQLFSPAIDVGTNPPLKHPHLAKLPHWPNETIAVLCTVDEAPYAIPVTAPLRVSDRTILFSLKDCRGSLARLRKYPQVALLILGEDDLAFTARGRAFVVQEVMTRAPGFVAVAIEAEEIDDHRLAGRAITSGAGIDWHSSGTQRLVRDHLDSLREIAERPGLKEALSIQDLSP